MPRGGYRPGSGRKPKDRSKQDVFPDAESYLTAVVMGTTVPDSVRVAAARVLIQYQTAKKRAKPESRSPSDMRKREAQDAEIVQMSEFEEKAQRIRERHERIKTDE